MPSRRERIPRWIEVAAAAVVVIGAVYAAIAFLADGAEELVGGSDGGSVEVSQVVLANDRTDMRLADGEFVVTDAGTPQLDITVRNRGKEAALLTKARITIEDSALLSPCEWNSGDLVPASKDYAIELPVLPTPADRVVVKPLHQEVPAGGVDRFRLLFRVGERSLDNFMYAIHVVLVTDASREPVDVGRFILGIPLPVTGNGRILPEGPYAPSAYPDQRLASTWCLRHNLAAVERLLSRPGKRSPRFAPLADFQFADWWEDFSDDRPPQAAVEPLLNTDVGPGPVLAGFAAEQTGDQQLIERTRRRAARLMIRESELALFSDYTNAGDVSALLARYSLALSPSPAARELLREAEDQAGLEAAEQEALELLDTE
jgi:hypothetical protein